MQKNHWIPVEISLPDSGRLVQIQTEELPDPTIGCFYAKQGRWSFEERNFSEMNIKENNIIKIFLSLAETKDFTSKLNMTS